MNGVAIELDEELHFNRYRELTLRSEVYQRLSGFPLEAYRDHARSREDECKKAGSYGGKWTNRSCEKQLDRVEVGGHLVLVKEALMGEFDRVREPLLALVSERTVAPGV